MGTFFKDLRKQTSSDNWSTQHEPNFEGLIYVIYDINND